MLLDVVAYVFVKLAVVDVPVLIIVAKARAESRLPFVIAKRLVLCHMYRRCSVERFWMRGFHLNVTMPTSEIDKGQDKAISDLAVACFVALPLLTSLLDRTATYCKMPIGKTLLWGFVGFVAIGTAFSMLSDPLDPEIAATSSDPGEWSVPKLKEYVLKYNLAIPGLDQSASNLSAEQQAEQRALALDDLSRGQLVNLVKDHREQQGSTRSSVRSPSVRSTASEQTPLLSSRTAESANEQLLQASNLK